MEYSQRRVTSVDVTVETDELVLLRIPVARPFEAGGSRELTCERSQPQDEQLDIKKVNGGVRGSGD